MNKLLLAIVLCFFTLLPLLTQAQDVKIYVSPHSLNLTMTKISSSLEKNGYEKLELKEYHSSSKVELKFAGVVFVISYQIDEFSTLVACEPTATLAMPLKISVWEDDADVFISYVDARSIKHQYAIKDCDEIIDSINKAQIRVVNDAIRVR